jgi:hypothetical protein
VSRPDFAAVQRDHRLHQSMNICTCRSWRATTNAGSLRDQHEAHLAAALNAAVDAWLADEKTQEAARSAIAAYEAEMCVGQGTLEDTSADEYAAAALAALRKDTP